MRFNFSCRGQYRGACVVLMVAAFGLSSPQQARAQSSSVSHGYWQFYKTDYDGEQRRHVNDLNPDYVSPWDWRTGISDSGDAAVTPVGVGGFTSTRGRIRPWFRWVRRTISQGSGYYTQNVPDPADNPPASLFFVAKGGATVNSISDFVNGGPWPPLNRMASTEYVTINIIGQSASGHDENHRTSAELQVEEVYNVATGGALQTSPEGYEVVPGPWLSLDVKAGLLGDRYTSSESGSGALTGRAGRGVSLNSEPQNYWATSPNPQGLALAPCPDPTPQPALNQYVMNGGGGNYFTIPTVVTHMGNSVVFRDQLISRLTWTIARPPSAMALQVSNGSSGTGSSASIFPQHVTYAAPGTTQGPPVRGLAFQNVLPASNTAFGVNSITHSFDGATFATSNFALFYNSTATTHPPGGPPGWVHFSGNNGYHAYEIPTPNWFYYYSQAFSIPKGYTINYRNTAGSGETPGEDHIHIGNDAHGILATDVFAKIGGLATVVGGVRVAGIDAFARVVTHEAFHRSMRTKYGFQWDDGVAEPNDLDDDGVPDDLEAGLGFGFGKDSTGWGAANGYDTSGDWEICARYAEYGVLGNADKDWADDGINFTTFSSNGKVLSPNRCLREKFTFYDKTKTKADYDTPAPPSVD